MSDDAERTERVERRRMAAEELSWSVRVLARAAAQVDHALAAKLDLRPLDYEAMGHIMDHEGADIGPAELGQRLRISTGSATELADRLERSGHIARTRASTDRRRVQLVAQQQAVGRILQELGPLFANLDELSTEFTAAERAVIERYLRAASERLQAHAKTLGASEVDHPQ
jgi:MarR family transcriptional regulator, organic hydroperoxide resistance regulator